MALDKTIDAAIEKGLRETGWSLSEVKVEVLDEGQKGLFRKRPAKVRLTKRMSSSNPIPANPAPSNPVPSAHAQGNDFVTADKTAILWENGMLSVAEECFQKTVSIVPPEHVQLYLNGQPLQKPAMIQNGDEVSDLLSGDIDGWLDIQTAQNGLEASIVLKENAKYKLKLQVKETMEHIVVSFVEQKREDFPFSVEDIVEYARDNGIVYGVDSASVEQWLKNTDKDRPCVIARGKEKKDGKPTQFVTLFETNAHQKEKHEQEGVVDWFRLQDIPSVDPGQKILEIIPPTDGEDGMNVFGKPISAKAGKNIAVRLGKGVTLSEDGRYVLADTNGRPEWYPPRISVHHVHIVQDDLDLETGSIKFDGDVLVSGDVLEGLSIEATGNVEIKGSVMKGKIKAGGHVTVGKNIINSEILAGGDATEMVFLLEQTENILNRLHFIEQVYDQLLQSASSRTEKMTQMNFGQFVKLILENKLPHLEKEIKQFQNDYESGTVQLDEARTWIDLLMKKMTGLGPLSMKSMRELRDLLQLGGQLSQILQESVQYSQDFLSSYVHNSTVKASGNIQVKGMGAYNSFLYAGRKIHIGGKTGVVRGGSLQAGTGVSVKELGGPGDVKTTVHVESADGYVEAASVHPGVLIRIRDLTHQIQRFDEHVRFEFQADANKIVTLH